MRWSVGSLYDEDDDDDEEETTWLKSTAHVEAAFSLYRCIIAKSNT